MCVLNLALPAQNIDQSTPVNLGRVDVYGYTGRTAPPPARFPEVAQRVGNDRSASDGSTATTLRDTLTRRRTRRRASPAAHGTAPQESRPRRRRTGAPLKRYYMAVAYSERGRAGPPSPVAEVPLTSLPDAPVDLRATYNAEAVTLSWEPSGGLLGFLFDRRRCRRLRRSTMGRRCQRRARCRQARPVTTCIERRCDAGTRQQRPRRRRLCRRRCP